MEIAAIKTPLHELPDQCWVPRQWTLPSIKILDYPESSYYGMGKKKLLQYELCNN